MSKLFLPAALALTVLASSAAPAALVAGPAVATENVESRLTLETEGAAPGQQVWVALTQKIRPHWHTYWLNPGDSGIATSIGWTLPAGWQAGDINWPAPERFPIGPLVNFGYKDTVHLLVPLTLPADAKPGAPVTLTAAVDWLVCEDICIPESATLTLDVPVVDGAAKPAAEAAALFTEARASLPVPSPYPVRLVPGEKQHKLVIQAPELAQGKIRDAFFFPDDFKTAASNAAQPMQLDGQGLTLALTPGGALPAGPAKGVLTFVEELDGKPLRHAFAISADTGAGAAAAPAAGARLDSAAKETAGTSLAGAILLALLGGMILNLMPCVFPVLSMKAMALISHGPGHARQHGLVYTAGVLACFAAIAGALLALRAGGAAIGWGFQLQDPLVVAVLAYVMLLLGLSLSGVFNIGTSAMGVGQGLASKGGLAGSFFTGVLATVVATPCTAPFMGTALGYAITQPWYAAMAVFLALGLGMALPFLALTFSPALLRRMPRPGLWMDRVKQALAFPLYASAAWLVWVLSVQAGPDTVAAVLAGMVAVAFAGWLYGVTRQSGTGWRVGGGLVALALVVASVLGAGRTAVNAAPAALAASSGPAKNYEAFSEARLDELRGQNKPVFVNFTAAWCVTCLVNERTSLSTEAVKMAMKQKGITYLKGDWTNRDAKIARILESHGRSGVPLYLLYLPGAAEPLVLPQLLTEGTVLEAMAPIQG
ncbi:protein-disulfide reductase DsbD domain-containing protein [Niveispirillum sp. BGYR6]|uniref:protein-disulfide reductase DsbD family protein n=1 Tax=Niveispirillum sp. BGYR6 TaxID=2971249 RepID=UPI0022B9BF0A|nr:protein-disulfide reductase DsbD domain-containing protein [Niveispirillum sp. BGYR6]MDG5495494.1 protein-disulfide reductase DsbD family protein [Niveispirillum sp. BGYR6]